MPSQSVVVIGGGLAGLACSVALADAGLQVWLHEKRPHLGGRATSYTLPGGEEVDNCQHVTLGCCTNLADFYARVNASGKIRFHDVLYFADRKGRRSRIESCFLPPPFHMAPSFLLFRGLSIPDKLSIARALLLIARRGGRPPGAESLAMLDWLKAVGQTQNAIARFWRVVLVSALDEELDRMAAQSGIDVFWKAFLASRRGYWLGVPAAPLASLYLECGAALTKRGGEVRLRSSAREVCLAGDSFSHVVFEGGSEVHADFCVVAAPQTALAGLFANPSSELAQAIAGLDNLRTSPITSVHFWFDRIVMREPFLALLEHQTQWVFNKSLLASPASRYAPDSSANGPAPANKQKDGPAQYLQLVISASYDLVRRSRQEIIDMCRTELREVLPLTRDANVLKATVIKEMNATFSPELGADRWRLNQSTNIRSLFFAGDWTLTGWPSTMEGAVRSGYLAAEAVLKAAGQPRTVLKPGLRPEGLCSRWAEAAGNQ